MEVLLASLTEAVRAFRAVFGNLDLRRVQLAFVGFSAAEIGTWMAVLVFAYEAGGTAAAGAIGVVQLILATIFAPLSVRSLERVASRLIPIEAPSGTEIVRQDDPGDRFCIIESGRVTVSKNGRRVATLEGGDFFGEIALLREMPRTATVTAQTDTHL